MMMMLPQCTKIRKKSTKIREIAFHNKICNSTRQQCTGFPQRLKSLFFFKKIFCFKNGVINPKRNQLSNEIFQKNLDFKPLRYNHTYTHTNTHLKMHFFPILEHCDNDDGRRRSMRKGLLNLI